MLLLLLLPVLLAEALLDDWVWACVVDDGWDGVGAPGAEPFCRI